MGLAALAALCVTGASFWLALWTQAYDKKEAVDIGLYLGVYAGMVLGEVVLRNVSLVMFRLGGWYAARTLHQKLIEAVMNVSLSWYTTTPTGRVINRFSRDISCLDSQLAALLYSVVQMVVSLLFRLGSISAILPIFFIPSAITCIVGFVIGEMYTRTGVILRRLESSSQSPVFSQFADTLAGLAVIRSRKSVPEKFGNLLAERLTLWSTAAEAMLNANRWVGMRIDFIASLVSLSAGVIALSKSSTISSGLVGFSLLHATTISTTILAVVRGLNDLEIELQSVSCHDLAEWGGSTSTDEQSSLTALKSICLWTMRKSPTTRSPEQGMMGITMSLLRTGYLGIGRERGRSSSATLLCATIRMARIFFPTLTSPSVLVSVLPLWAGLHPGKAL